jgi:hypothetical protein
MLSVAGYIQLPWKAGGLTVSTTKTEQKVARTYSMKRDAR